MHMKEAAMTWRLGQTYCRAVIPAIVPPLPSLLELEGWAMTALDMNGNDGGNSSLPTFPRSGGSKPTLQQSRA